MFFRTVNGSDTTATVTPRKISLISDLDGNATNYAVVHKRLASSSKDIAAAINDYYYDGAITFTGDRSVITPYEISASDLGLVVTDGGGTNRDWNVGGETQVEYAFRYAYDLSRFVAAGSDVAVGGGRFALNANGRIEGMFVTDDFVEFEMTFDGQPSVSDKGTYATVI